MNGAASLVAVGRPAFCVHFRVTMPEKCTQNGAGTEAGSND